MDALRTPLDYANPGYCAAQLNNPGRDEWQQPQAVVDWMLAGGAQNIVEIGAATGYFSERLAKALPDGYVVALDSSQPMVDWLQQHAEGQKLWNLDAQWVPADAPQLKELGMPIHIVLLAYTLNEISAPAQYLRSLRAPLIRCGGEKGELVVLDSQDPEIGSYSREQVISLLEGAGWVLTREADFLEGQYLLAFEPA